jgi:hypothetical protein
MARNPFERGTQETRLLEETGFLGQSGAQQTRGPLGTRLNVSFKR